MTRTEAEQLVTGLGTALGVKTGLNPAGRAGLAVETASLFLRYHPETADLRCSALVYSFHAPPKPGLVEGFTAEAQAGTDTGGGTVDYEATAQGLFLTRTYQRPPHPQQFVLEMKKLLKASLQWSDEVFPRVAGKVFHPAG
jgi:hypothetical protein